MLRTATAIVLTAGLGAATAHGAVIETFNYTPGVLGTASTSGTGQTGNYGNFVFAGSTGGASNMVVIDGSLTAPSGYGFTPTNDRVAVDGPAGFGGAGIFTLAASETIDFGADSTTYVSFLVRAFQNGSVQGLVGLVDSGGANIVRVGEGNSGGFLQIDSSSVTTGVDQMDSNGANVNGEDNLVVFKIETSATGNDLVSASFWDSLTGTVTAEPLTWQITNSFDSSSVGVAVRMDVSDGFSDLDASIDEIRFGDSFEAVTAVPEPATAALLGLGGLMMAMRRRSA